MSMFLLTPQHLGSPEWNLSSWQVPIRIEAPTPLEARLEAERQFSRMPDDSPQQTVFQPWWHPVLVDVRPCDALEDSDVPLLSSLITLWDMPGTDLGGPDLRPPRAQS